MSEKTPGSHQFTDAERERLWKINRAVLEESARKLDEIAKKLGYAPVETFEKLGLTPSQIGSLTVLYGEDRNQDEKYYQADRKDGGKVQVVVLPTISRDYLLAEFFYAGNHYFSHKYSLSLHDVEEIMKFCLDADSQF